MTDWTKALDQYKWSCVYILHLPGVSTPLGASDFQGHLNSPRRVCAPWESMSSLPVKAKSGSWLCHPSQHLIWNETLSPEPQSPRGRMGQHLACCTGTVLPWNDRLQTGVPGTWEVFKKGSFIQCFLLQQCLSCAQVKCFLVIPVFRSSLPPQRATWTPPWCLCRPMNAPFFNKQPCVWCPRQPSHPLQNSQPYLSKPPEDQQWFSPT